MCQPLIDDEDVNTLASFIQMRASFSAAYLEKYDVHCQDKRLKGSIPTLMDYSRELEQAMAQFYMDPVAKIKPDKPVYERKENQSSMPIGNKIISINQLMKRKRPFQP